MQRLPKDEQLRQRVERLQARTFEFASRVLDLCPRRHQDDPSRVIWRQVVRSAPSSCANLEEADESSSDEDFVYRMKVATREMKESRRWLRFISRCKLANFAKLGNLEDEARQLASIFATIVIRTKERMARGKEEKKATVRGRTSAKQCGG
jgi:four helix bundle protein